MRRWLPALIALLLFPWLIIQGRRTRRRTPRLPEASGPAIGLTQIMSTEQPLVLLSIGESPVAGVGVSTHAEAITAQFATVLSMRLQRTVSWQAVGINGATLKQANTTMLPQVTLHKADIVLIAFGVNDTIAFRSCHHYRNELLQLIRSVHAQIAPRLMVISGVPPIHAFPALPEPLRYVLGMKAKTLDATVEQLLAALPPDLQQLQIIRVPVLMNVNDHNLMAVDGYHPSVSGVSLWARQLATAVDAQWKFIKKSKVA